MEKGSMLTAIEHGSVGPKRMAKAISESKAVYNAKNLIVHLSTLVVVARIYIYIRGASLSIYNISKTRIRV